MQGVLGDPGHSISAVWRASQQPNTATVGKTAPARRALLPGALCDAPGCDAWRFMTRPALYFGTTWPRALLFSDTQARRPPLAV